MTLIPCFVRNTIVLGNVQALIIVAEDEFLLQLWSFFSDVYGQSFQNIIIILRIDGSFLALVSEWDHMSINDSMFIKKKKMSITLPTDLA